MGVGNNVYNRRAYCFASAQEIIFALDPQVGGSTKTYADGGYRIRSQAFAIKNIDQGSTAPALQFSFDNTNYSKLEPGEGFSLNLSSDRFYIKSDTGDASCEYLVTAALMGGR